jgi:serine/threonine-protein kinase
MARIHVLIGKTLAGKYRIKEQLGEGAMAEVLRAEQDGEPRQVAVKVMRHELASDPMFAARFRREAKAAARLSHPGTVRVLDYGEDDGRLFLVMELLEGSDLFDVLATAKRLPELQSAEILIGVCDALAAAHGEGIVHRDLKPENVFLKRGVSGAEAVKIVDFGVAKMLEADVAPSSNNPTSDAPPSSRLALTRAGVIVGTPEFMSPEQYRGEAIGPRTDLYACGVMLYQMVTGRPPFTSDNPFRIAIMHAQDAPMPPSTYCLGLHAGLEALILQALEKDAANRPASASAFADALRAILPELRSELAPAAPTHLLKVDGAHPFEATVPESARSMQDLPTLPPPKPSLDMTMLSEGAPTIPAPPRNTPVSDAAPTPKVPTEQKGSLADAPTRVIITASALDAAKPRAPAKAPPKVMVTLASAEPMPTSAPVSAAPLTPTSDLPTRIFVPDAAKSQPESTEIIARKRAVTPAKPHAATSEPTKTPTALATPAASNVRVWIYVGLAVAVSALLFALTR